MVSEVQLMIAEPCLRCGAAAGDEGHFALQPIGALVPRLPIGLRLELAFVAGKLILVDHRFHDFGHVGLLWGHSLGAMPMPSRSNSSAVAWLSSFGLVTGW